MGALQEAVKNCQYDRLRDGSSKAPGLLGWAPDKACTFVDNHDTGSTQQVRARDRQLDCMAWLLDFSSLKGVGSRSPHCMPRRSMPVPLPSPNLV